LEQVCIFYTTIGGLKAVIWTNVFQAGCMFFSSLVVVIIGDLAVGGSSEVFR
jgi:Na+/proline symporter